MTGLAAALALTVCTASPQAAVDAGAAPLGDAGAPKVVPPSILRPSPAQPAGGPGDVALLLTIDAQGAVTDVRVLESPTEALAASAVEAARQLVFSPATLGGAPVSVQISFTYHFVEQPKPPPPAPAAVLGGRVLSRGSRAAIPGAAVSIDPDTDGGVSVIAGADGSFSSPVAVGVHAVRVQAGGFEAQSFTESLFDGQHLEVIYRLMPSATSPFQTIVHAPSERTEVSRVTLSGAEIHDVAGTMGDPIRVVLLMPGVSSVASGIAYPVVRGSDPSDTGYYLDGIPIPILFHLLLGPEVVSPDFIQSVDFYPSNAPIDLGRHLTGGVNLTTAPARTDGVHATAYADLINAGAFAEASFPQTGTTVAAAARTSYTGWLAQLVADALEPKGSGPLVLDFSDYQVRVEQAVGGGRLRLFVFGSTDTAGVGASDSMPAELETVQFVRADLRYQHPLWGGQGEVGLTYGDDVVGQSGSLQLSERSARLRAQWKRDLANAFHLVLGMDADLRRAVISLGGGSNDSGIDTTGLESEGFNGVPTATGSFSGLYGELTWRPSAPLSLTAGMRVDNYLRMPSVDDLAAEPRLAARYQWTDALAFRAAAGVVHEPPVLLIDIPAVALGALGHGLQEGLQTEVGAEWTFLNGNQLDTTVYYNPLFRTVELGIPGGNAVTAADAIAPPDLDPVSHGEAFGLEVLLRHPLGGNWFGWISGALAWSLRYQTWNLLDADGNPTGATASGMLPFAFDETVIANAALTYRLPHGWSVGGVIHFNTGRPESGVLGSYTELQRVVNGQPTWVPVQLNQVDRLPPFYRLDLQVSKTWTFDLVTLEGYFDVLNATVDWETLGFQYGATTNGNAAGNPVGTSLTKTPISVPIVLPMLGLRVRY